MSNVQRVMVQLAVASLAVLFFACSSDGEESAAPAAAPAGPAEDGSGEPSPKHIPSDSTGLTEGVPAEGELPDGSRQGVNDGEAIRYRGPCPPPFAIIDASASGDVVRSKSGSVQKYYFRLYALDSALDLAPGATKEDLLQAMEGHVLGAGEFAGERVGRKMLKHQ